MKFIKLTVKNHEIMHGFDHENKEIIEKVIAEKSSVKLIAIDRILSISEKFVLTSYHDRLIYWEYEEKFSDVVLILNEFSLAVTIK